MAGRMDDNQLNTVKGLPGITPDERNTFDSALINNQYVRSNPEAGQMIAQAAPPPQEPMPTDRMTGIAQAGGDMFNTMGNGMAGGGIIAFAGEGPSLVKDLPDMSAEEYGKYISEVMSSDIPVDRKKRIAPMLGDALSQLTKKENPTQETKIEPTKTVFRGDAKTPSKELSRADYVKEQQDMLRMLGVNPDVVGEKGKAYQKRLEETQAGIGDKEAQLERFARTQGFLSLLDPSEGRSNLQQAARGFGKYIGNKAENAKTIEELKNTTIKAQAELEAGNRARAAGDIEAANKHFDKARELQNQLDVARGNNAATIQAAEIHASAAGQATKAEEAKIEAYLKDHPGATRSEAYAAVAQYARGESNEITRLKAAIELKQKQLYGPGTAEEKAKIQREIQTLTQQLLQSGAKPVAAAPYEKTPTYDKGSEVTYNGEKYRFKGGDQYDKKNWEKV
jgi:tellurite resistance protein